MAGNSPECPKHFCVRYGDDRCAWNARKVWWWLPIGPRNGNRVCWECYFFCSFFFGFEMFWVCAHLITVCAVEKRVDIDPKSIWCCDFDLQFKSRSITIAQRTSSIAHTYSCVAHNKYLPINHCPPRIINHHRQHAFGRSYGNCDWMISPILTFVGIYCSHIVVNMRVFF